MMKVEDVAEYILVKLGPIPAMKLQKLVFYSQAWSLVWDERALFTASIEGWANGPVCRDLYALHSGSYTVQTVNGDVSKVDATARETIDVVLKYYGDKTSQWLSDSTHSEQPWQDARLGLAPGQRGFVEITHAALAEYYGGL